MSIDILESRLLLPIGPPFSGKTRLAERLREEGLLDDNSIIDADQIRKDMTGSTDDTTHDDSVLARCEERAHALIDDGERVYLNYSFPDSDGLQDLIRLADRFASQVCVIYMDTPLQTILARASDAKRYGLTKVHLELLVDAVDRADIPWLGLPCVMASVLSVAVDGQDDW